MQWVGDHHPATNTWCPFRWYSPVVSIPSTEMDQQLRRPSFRAGGGSPPALERWVIGTWPLNPALEEKGQGPDVDQGISNSRATFTYDVTKGPSVGASSTMPITNASLTAACMTSSSKIFAVTAEMCRIFGRSTSAWAG